MVVSQNRGDPNIGPQNTMTLIMGTPKMVPLILGNLHINIVMTWGHRETGSRTKYNMIFGLKLRPKYF